MRYYVDPIDRFGIGPGKLVSPGDFDVIDADTGEVIEAVIWCDDVTGEYEAYDLDERGLAHLDSIDSCAVSRVRGKAKLQVIFNPKG